MTGERPNEWQRHHDELMVEMERQVKIEDRRFRRERLFLVLLLVVPFTIAGALVGQGPGWHPSLMERLGSGAGLGFITVLLALRLFDPREG